MIDLLKAMRKKAFDADFHASIAQNYAQIATNGIYIESEKDYVTAIEALKEIYSAKERKLLTEMEAQFSENRTYVAEYSFQSGMFCGFDQFFSLENRDRDGGFDRFVFRELFELPRMEQHKSYDCISRCNELGAMLRCCANGNAIRHLDAVNVAWKNRIYHAALRSFYMGYRAALLTTERINPAFRFENSKRMLALDIPPSISSYPCSE